MIRKKKKAHKEKKVRKSLNEHETVSYEQQLLDNNRQLSRLRSRNEELECEVKALTSKYEQLQEDRADVVAHLKRELEGKIEEARELGERLQALEELRKAEQAEYKKRESAMEFEYRTMESNLSAEVKLAAGKLNALEDWRLARLDLMHKFEVQEEQIAKQEELHKTQLFETERSVIIAKAKMQEEMEERLRQLAHDFKEATNIRVADVMQNAIRRNVALNHELNTMLRVCEDLETRSAECKDNERVLRLQCELFEVEAELAREDMTKSRRVMHRVAQDYVDMLFERGRVQRENARLRNYEQLVNEYETRCVTSEERIRALQQQLEETRRAKEAVLAEVRNKYERFDKAKRVLNEARECVSEVLQLQKHVDCASDVCPVCCAEHKQNILHMLRTILEERDISDILKDDDSQATLETIKSMSDGLEEPPLTEKDIEKSASIVEILRF